MAISSGFGFGVQLVAGAVLATGLGLGGYFIYQAVSDPVVQNPPVMAAPKPVSKPDQAAETTTPTTTPAIALQPQPPTFDVVRIEADGASVIAGNAPAGADVAILMNGAKVGHATADANGKFVALLTLPTSMDAQVLSLSVQDDAGQLVMSKDQVIVAPTARPTVMAQADVETPKNSPDTVAATTADTAVEQSQVATEEIAEEIAEETAEITAEILAEDTTEITTEDATETVVAQAEEPQPSAPAVLLANEQGVRVLQPASPNPSVINNVAIDAISYDAQGDVQLSGRGTGGDLGDGFIRIYLNDAPVQTTGIDNNGGWQTALPDVDTGIYTLRVDQIDAAGDVTSRVQTPFKRETAATLESANSNGNVAPITAVTVQPGSTLWAIARETYGDGALYIRVFEANSANIRNPDLIYPGQVFTVPN